MKVLKNMAIGLLNFILFSLVFALVLSFSLKSFFSEAFVGDVVKEQLSTQLTDTLETDDSNIKEILENEEINEFVNDYVNKTIEGVVDPSSLDDVDMSEDIISFVRENESKLEEQLGVDISVEKIEELIQSDKYQQLETDYKKAVESVSTSVPKSQKNLIKVYNFLLSTNFKLIVSGLIAVILILLSLLQKSLYKWLKYLGVSTMVSGIFVAIMGLVVSFIINSVVKGMSYNINFKVDYMLICALITFIIGIAIYVIYKIVDVFVMRNKKNVVVDSEVV